MLLNTWQDPGQLTTKAKTSLRLSGASIGPANFGTEAALVLYIHNTFKYTHLPSFSTMSSTKASVLSQTSLQNIYTLAFCQFTSKN